jgi:hypothetical protein
MARVTISKTTKSYEDAETLAEKLRELIEQLGIDATVGVGGIEVGKTRSVPGIWMTFTSTTDHTAKNIGAVVVQMQ